MWGFCSAGAQPRSTAERLRLSTKSAVDRPQFPTADCFYSEYFESYTLSSSLDQVYAGLDRDINSSDHDKIGTSALYALYMPHARETRRSGFAELAQALLRRPRGSSFRRVGGGVARFPGAAVY